MINLYSLQDPDKILEIDPAGEFPIYIYLSSDKSINMIFNINDINQILNGNFEDVFQNLLTNE